MFYVFFYNAEKWVLTTADILYIIKETIISGGQKKCLSI